MPKVRTISPVCLVVVLALMTGSVLAEAPELEEVSPTQAFVDEDVTLTLTGQGLETVSSAALLDGGPYISARLDLEGSVYAAAAINERYGALTLRDTLRIIDMVDPHNPLVVGVAPLPTGISLLHSDGEILVVSGYGAGGTVSLYDVREPADPRLLSSVSPDRLPSRVALHDKKLYLGSEQSLMGLVCLDGDLEVLDISDPTDPVFLGSTRVGCVQDIHVEGSVADILTWTSYPLHQARLTTYDVSDPGALVELSTSAWPNGDGRDSLGFAAADGFGYVLHEYPGMFRAVDLHDSTEPVVTSEVFLAPGNFYRLLMGQGALFSGGHRMTAYDLAQPARPVKAGEIGIGVSQFSVQGKSILFFDPRTGTGAMDFTEIRRPESVLHFDDIPARSVETSIDNTVFTRGSWRRMDVQIIDIGDPRAPETVASIAESDDVVSMATDGRYLYTCGSRPERITIYDALDPSNLQKHGEVAVPCSFVVASNRFAYSYRWREESLTIIDASDPSMPVEAGRLDLAEQPNSMHVSEDGDYLYMSVAGGLQVISLADPLVPEFRGRIAYDRPYGGMVYDGRWLWGVERDHSVVRIDPSNPDAPEIAARFDLEGVRSVARSGDSMAAVIEGDISKVVIFDVSDPDRLVLSQEHDGQTSDLAGVDGSFLFHRLSRLRTIPAQTSLGSPRPVMNGMLEVPLASGRPPGIYDVYVNDLEGKSSRIRNAIRLCERREFRARLVPVVDPPRAVLPARWRLHVEADEELETEGAALLLPPLDHGVVTSYRVSGGPDVIVLTSTSGSAATVEMIGVDENHLRSLWEEAHAAGGFPLARLTDDTFGEPLLEQSSDPVSPSDPGVRQWVFTFQGDQLDAVLARGAGLDLEFRADGLGPRSCRFEERVSLQETIAEFCAQFAGTIRCLD